MIVQVKLLKGYVNPINDESNSVSLLIKSDCQLREQISKGLNKILTALKCIIKKYDAKYSLFFYHKIKISCNNNKEPEYYCTKKHEMHEKTIDKELSNSTKEILKKISVSYYRIS